MLPFGLQPIHLIVIAIVALLIFGPQRLPEIGRGVGRAINEFRKGAQEMTENLRDEVVNSPAEAASKPAASQATAPAPAPAPAPAAASQTCPQCGAPNAAGVRFCNHCGAQLVASPAPVQPAAAQACPQCGAQNPAEGRFCNQCGAQLPTNPA